MNGTTVFFDLETGGLEPHHPTIQIAAVAMAPGWREIDSIERKLLFDESACDPEALEINSYDIDDWRREAVAPAVARQNLQTFFEHHATWQLVSKKGNHYNTCRIAGHNAAHFDAPRLKALWGERFAPFAWFYPLDTVHLALWYFSFYDVPQPRNYQLQTLCDHFEIVRTGAAHDALADVRSTAMLAREILCRLVEMRDLDFSDTPKDENPGLRNS